MRLFHQKQVDTPIQVPRDAKVILVTGANRGIGVGIVEVLVKAFPTSHILLGARILASGEEAVKELKENNAIPPDANVTPIELNVLHDPSIKAAVAAVERKFGRLDVLVNNAGIAIQHKPDLSDLRSAFDRTYDTNVTSVALVTMLFAPLLQKSSDPRVIQISAGRASLDRASSPSYPPAITVEFSVSKTALNALTVELSKEYRDITFYSANPGYCRTALNGYSGTREPIDGALIVEKLIAADQGTLPMGFYEYENGHIERVPW